MTSANLFSAFDAIASQVNSLSERQNVIWALRGGGYACEAAELNSMTNREYANVLLNYSMMKKLEKHDA